MSYNKEGLGTPQDTPWHERVETQLTGIQSVRYVRASLALARGLSLTFRGHVQVLMMALVCQAPALLALVLVLVSEPPELQAFVGLPWSVLLSPFVVLSQVTLVLVWLGMLLFKATLSDLAVQRMDKSAIPSMVKALGRALRHSGTLSLLALVQMILILLPLFGYIYLYFEVAPQDRGVLQFVSHPLTMALFVVLMLVIRLSLQFCASAVMLEGGGVIHSLGRSIRLTADYVGTSLGLAILRTALITGLLVLSALVLALGLKVHDIVTSSAVVPILSPIDLTSLPSWGLTLARALGIWLLLVGLILGRSSEIGLFIEINAVEDNVDAPTPDRA